MKLTSVLALLATVAAAPLAYAKPAGEPSQQAYLVPYLGWYDVTQSDNQAAQFGLEYRAKAFAYNIRPGGGAFITSDGAIYGYAGLFWDLPLLGGKYFLTPNFSAGAYSHGDGKKLGGAIEFRSGLEFSYTMPNSNARVGVAFNHISNASIYDRNPGVETLLINYHLPVNF